MTFVVTKNCIRCKYTDCVEACPADAFHEGPEMLVINPESCTDCANCVTACPVEAIFDEKDLPPHFVDFLHQNAQAASEWPVILHKKDPLPSALTLGEILAKTSLST